MKISTYTVVGSVEHYNDMYCSVGNPEPVHRNPGLEKTHLWNGADKGKENNTTRRTRSSGELDHI